jgi:hypothetical protein
MARALFTLEVRHVLLVVREARRFYKSLVIDHIDDLLSLVVGALLGLLSGGVGANVCSRRRKSVSIIGAFTHNLESEK